MEQDTSGVLVGGSNEWIHVQTGMVKPQFVAETVVASPRSRTFDRGTIVLAPNINRHNPVAYLKVNYYDYLNFVIYGR